MRGPHPICPTRPACWRTLRLWMPIYTLPPVCCLFSSLAYSLMLSTTSPLVICFSALAMSHR
ncbi:hypothetical protein RSAG8_13513, partial [Rhizoctonia solani AG-8 WAC10335]